MMKTADSVHVQLGAKPQFQSVGLLYNRAGNNGSVVLVHPQWVLTAASLLEDASAASLEVQMGTTRYKVTTVQLHPDVGKAGTPGVFERHGVDLALLRLEKPVTGVVPAARYRGSDEKGRTATFAGFGQIQPQRLPSGRMGISMMADAAVDSIRRAGTNVIDVVGGAYKNLQVPSHYLGLDFDFPDDDTKNRMGDARPVDLEYLPGMLGDIGGGLFIEQGGAWQLAGIHSVFMMSRPQNGEDAAKYGLHGSTAWLVRVAHANSWIDATVAR
jgi:hypothetical protein